MCLLVTILARSRTVLDAAALVAMFFELLDTLRANGAVLVHGKKPFTPFADSSVRGANTAVNKDDFAAW